jgi:N6-adenosine-specific RNA methylase IME4
MQNEIKQTKEIIIKPEFKNLLPELSDQQKLWLEQDIVKNGCLQPLVLWNETLVDGHHRYEICRRHNISFATIDMQFNSEIEAMYWCWTSQKNRRNLTAYELGKIALQFEPLIRDKAKENQGKRTDIPSMLTESLKPIDTREELAKISELSAGTITKIKAIEEQAPIILKNKLLKQELSINQAYQLVKREEKLKKVEQNILAFKQNPAPTGFVDIYNTDKRYNIIYADPCWQYRVNGMHAADLHYKTMSIGDICALPVKNIADKNCILFLWVTHPILPDAFKVIDAWGFNYSTCGFCWVKKNQDGSNFFGLGNWTRANSEVCLIAVKGSVARIDASISQIVESAIEEHSKKPNIVRDLIVKLIGDLPKIELFSRQAVSGWDCWGNEITTLG